jgi:hypothetical protein
MLGENSYCTNTQGHFAICIEHLRYAKVNHFKVEFVWVLIIAHIDQEVLWLHIPMDDIPCMAMGYSRKQLHHYIRCLILAEDFFLHDSLEKLLPLA